MGNLARGNAVGRSSRFAFPTPILSRCQTAAPFRQSFNAFVPDRDSGRCWHHKQADSFCRVTCSMPQAVWPGVSASFGERSRSRPIRQQTYVAASICILAHPEDADFLPTDEGVFTFLLFRSRRSPRPARTHDVMVEFLAFPASLHPFSSSSSRSQPPVSRRSAIPRVLLARRGGGYVGHLTV